MTYLQLFSAATLAGALALSATVAWAASTVREACAADVRAVCAGVKPGSGRIVACMRQHTDQLSQVCLQALQSRSGQ